MRRIFVYEHLSGAGSIDGDELLGPGLAMRDAVTRDLLRIGACAVSVAAGRHAHEAPAGALTISPHPGEAAADFVARQTGRHDQVWVIAPETDGVLARLRRVVDDTRWLGCNAEAIAIASSKRATLARAAASGLLTPLGFDAAPETRRWVVKPDDGAGSVATRLHATRAAAEADAAERRRTGAAPTLEAWVEGEPLSLSLMCRADRTELLSVNRQQIAIDAGGVLSFDGVQVNAWPRDDARAAALRAWAQQVVATVPGLCGFVGIDFVWHKQRGPVLIELNPRVTMAYVGLSATLGRNLASEVLAAHASRSRDAR